MPQPTQSKTKGNGRAKHAAKSGNGNGRAALNGRANGNGKIGSRANGNGRPSNGAATNGNGAVATDEVRRIASEMGRAMLVATSVETARHSDDVELITGAISEKIGLSESERDDVLAGARLHDIGKTSVPPEILLKPGPLDAGEWEVMRGHTIVGEQILVSVEELKDIARLVRHSHERWDGEGYPDGLAGAEIPLGSRIIFCADAFHAVRSDRPYRKGRSAKASLAEIKRCAGTQFDPDVVAALEAVVRELQIVGPARRVRRSSRLTALLLMLAVGGGSSAIARTDLLGDPNPAGPSSGLVGSQSSLSGPVLLEQMNALGLNGPARSIGPRRGAPGSGVPGSPVNSVTTDSGPGPYGVGNSGEALGPSVGGGDGHGAGAGGGSGVSDDRPAGGGGSPGGGGTSGGGGNGNGNGGGNGNGNGGGNGNGNGGTAGQSGNAPGHGGSCPGNSCNAPGHQPGGPGNSGNAPGHNRP